ncbi:MAG: hypothetical protein AABZ30_00040 [Myxococcota bacterium]
MRPIALIGLLSATLGCATIFNGSTTDVKIDSRPTAARFTIVSSKGIGLRDAGNEVANGKTPAKVRLNNSTTYVVTVKAEGYREAKVFIDQSFNAWTICSIACGLIGVGVDLLSGGMWDLKPDQIMVTLETAAPAPAQSVAATASSGEPRAYLVLYRRDAPGEMRRLAVPLVRETP